MWVTVEVNQAALPFADRLADVWGLGESAAILLAMTSRREVSVRNHVLVELYLLVILRWMELKWGVAPVALDEEPGDEADGPPAAGPVPPPVPLVPAVPAEVPNRPVTQAELAAAVQAQTAGLQFQMTSMQGSLNDILAAIAATPAARASTAPAVASGPPLGRRPVVNQMADSEGDSEGEERDFDINDNAAASAERNRTARGLNHLRGAPAGRPALQGERDGADVRVSTSSESHYLFTAAPVPSYTAPPPVQGPVTGSWQRCEYLRAGIESSVATWSDFNREVSLETLNAAALSENGLLVFGITGVPHTYEVRKDRCDPILRCELYNPGQHPGLTRLSAHELSPYLVPKTFNHWLLMIEALEPSYFVFPHSTSHLPAPACLQGEVCGSGTHTSVEQQPGGYNSTEHPSPVHLVCAAPVPSQHLDEVPHS
jgi:hypothetical protein